MEIKQNYDLSRVNTFGVQVFAKFFVELNSLADLEELFLLPEFKNSQRLFLGGGSNVLLISDWDGIVILNKIKGIEIIKENTEFVWLKINSGEIWQDLVSFSVQKNYWGIENLALIPGTVGAAPMQNIGAYGAEIKDVLENVEVVDLENLEKKVFNNSECEFGYRESVFKNKFKNKYFILSVILKLSKLEKKNLDYKALKEYVEKNNLKVNSPKVISEVVSDIRRSKLPDPKVIGNAGSFFKNIFVSKEKFQSLIADYPSIPFFTENEKHKIPAGWLIEQCGWKGKRIGNVGVYEKQSLVIVNYGGATGEEIRNFAEQIINSVFLKFGLKLDVEVNLI